MYSLNSSQIPNFQEEDINTSNDAVFGDSDKGVLYQREFEFLRMLLMCHIFLNQQNNTFISVQQLKERKGQGKKRPKMKNKTMF